MKTYRMKTSWGSVSAGSEVYKYTGQGSNQPINIAQGRFAGQSHVAVTLVQGSNDYFIVPEALLVSERTLYGPPVY